MIVVDVIQVNWEASQRLCDALIPGAAFKLVCKPYVFWKMKQTSNISHCACRPFLEDTGFLLCMFER